MGKTVKTLWNNPWSMAGSEGTFEYDVRAVSLRGRVGVRKITNDLDTAFRIRVEPAPGISAAMIAKMAKIMPREKGWKQPGDDGQQRFSIVAFNQSDADAALIAAETALGEAELESFERKSLEVQKPAEELGTNA